MQSGLPALTSFDVAVSSNAKRLAWVAGLAALLFSAAGLATNFTGSLTGSAESPPNASGGTGATIVSYDPATHILNVTVNFSGLSSGTTASHIHCCTPTPLSGNAGVATQTPTFVGFPLGVTSGSYQNTFDLTQASSWNPAFITANGGTPASAEAVFAAAILARETYLNIHTTNFTGGEIRAFLIPLGPGNVPTLGIAGMVLLAAGLAFGAYLFLRRRSARSIG